MKEKKKHKNKASPLSKAPYVRRSKEELASIIGEIRSGSISIWGACKESWAQQKYIKLWMTRLRVRSLTDKINTTVLPGNEENKKAEGYK